MNTPSPAPDNAAERLAYINKTIATARARFDADGRPVELVAVSKTFDADAIRPLLAAGQRVFGENRVQEAKGKWPALGADYADIELHLIGPLQTNKVRDAVGLFDVIETVDRDKLAAALAAEFARSARRLDCYVQVNIGSEPQKAGIAIDAAVEFVGRCQQVHKLPIVGLMAIPPAGAPPGPYFAQLAELARQANLDKLSMGMSADYQTAIAMGATSVRIGSALFGSRPPAGAG